MRIVIVNTLYPPSQIGGAEKSVSLLAESLAKRGDSVTVVSLHSSESETVEDLAGVKVYRIPLDNSYWPYDFSGSRGRVKKLAWHLRDAWNSKAARRFERILDREMPDVVHTNVLTGFSVSLWTAARRRKLRLVHTLRDYSLMCVRSSLFRNGNSCRTRCMECKLLTSFRKKDSATVDFVVSNSRFVLDAHTDNGFFRGVSSSVIYSIADLNAKERTPEPLEHSGPTIFGFIGRIDQEKGIEVLLKATRALAGENWRLKIAGRGSEEYIQSLRIQYPNPKIEWLGYIATKEFFMSIDIVVVSSVWAEPLPRTLIEALAFGKSAICAASGGIPEISHFGKKVELYASKDHRALARIMDDALCFPDKWSVGGFINGQIVENFKESSVTAKYRAAYSPSPSIAEVQL